MPHLHIREFKSVSQPSFDGVEFGFVAQNSNIKDEKLIATKIGDDEFFLLLKEEDGRVLLKTDKVTRPSATHIAHRALLAYAKAANLEILSSNVPEKKQNLHLKEMDALKDISFFAANFNDTRELRIEVGFGSGRHLLHQASQNRDTLFIGLEIHRPSLEQVLKQINIQNLDNIYLLDYDARLFIEMLESNSVGAIYVHFPVPWDKKPHRRVISLAFVSEAKRVLKVGGTLELRTDSKEYYDYSYETILSFEKSNLHIYKNRDLLVSSKYEDRWKRMQKDIYDLCLINDEISPPLKDIGSFDEIDVMLDSYKIEKLYKAVKRFDEGFVNFERFYRLKDGVMFRLAFGSYERVEHLYLILRDKKATYFPRLPLRSKANILAHRYIKEILHG